MEQAKYSTEVKADAINNAIRLFCLRACEYVNTSLCKECPFPNSPRRLRDHEGC